MNFLIAVLALVIAITVMTALWLVSLIGTLWVTRLALMIALLMFAFGRMRMSPVGLMVGLLVIIRFLTWCRLL